MCSLGDCFSYFSTLFQTNPLFFSFTHNPKKKYQGFFSLNIKYNTKAGMELQNLVWNLCTREGYLRWQWFMVPIFFFLEVSPTSDFSHFHNELNMKFCFLIFVGFCNCMFFAAPNTVDGEEFWWINLCRHVLVLELVIRKIRWA